VDGDGSADLIWRHSTTGQVYVWLMNGTRVNGYGSLGTVGLQWQIAGVGDVDGDGSADLIWRHSTTGQVDIWLLNGTSIKGGGSLGTADLQWQIQP
jgi:hypothetical protein